MKYRSSSTPRNLTAALTTALAAALVAVPPAAATNPHLVANSVPAAVVAPTAKRALTVRVTITAPKNVPATVQLKKSRTTLTATKPAAGTRATVTLRSKKPGRYRVTAPPLTLPNGRLYTARISRPTVSLGRRPARLNVRYRPSPTIKQPAPPAPTTTPTPTPTPTPTTPVPAAFTVAVDGDSVPVTYGNSNRTVGTLTNVTAGQYIAVHAYHPGGLLSTSLGSIWLEDATGEELDDRGMITSNQGGRAARVLIPNDAVFPIKIVMRQPDGTPPPAETLVTASTIVEGAAAVNGPTSDTYAVTRPGQLVEVALTGVTAGQQVAVTTNSNISPKGVGVWVYWDHPLITVHDPDGRLISATESGDQDSVETRTFTATKSGRYVLRWDPRQQFLGTVSVTTTQTP